MRPLLRPNNGKSDARKAPGSLFRTAAALALITLGFSAAGQSTNQAASQPLYVPDYSHANTPMTNGILSWDSEQRELEATNGQDQAGFTFSFTNISADTVAILEASGSCRCTTIQLPKATPWLIPAGATGQFSVTINLTGKTGTLFKAAIITTDKGIKYLSMKVNILPPPPPRPLTETERAQGLATAKVDRQAVFKGDCATCHARNLDDKYGQQLFAATCAICHEANPRATMVPDLHNLKDPTSEEFWRTWITSGKAGTLMPAFATSQGGPLNDFQIASLAAWLHQTIPNHALPAAVGQPQTK